MPQGKTTKIEPWRRLLTRSLAAPRDLARRFGISAGAEEAALRYPALVNPYAASLIKGLGDPLGRQFLPDAAELADADGDDPLCEEEQSPAPGLVHRYPDRVLLLATSRCAVHCRYCMRKRIVRGGAASSPGALRAALAYIREHQEVSEAILSGGDPFLLSDRALFRILDGLAAIPHVERLRIHTRAPGVLPQRITRELCRGLSRYRPLYVNVQMNHPAELTDRAKGAFARLADAGLVLGSQSVLLAGVNDDPETLAELFRGLARARVKPYYLHQLDRVGGVEHFAVPAARGAAIAEGLWGLLPPEEVPHYVVDLPGGGGKVPLAPGGGLGEEAWAGNLPFASRPR